MSSIRFKSPYSFFIPLVLLLIGIFMVMLGPSEATIGSGIRIVYVHVAFIWAGLIGLLITGLLGITVLITDHLVLAAWLERIGWVSLGVFALGVFTSLLAEIVNWGGIAWREPRTAANLNLLAVATVFQVINSWIKNRRIRGLFHALVALAAIWITATTELQLHPSGAIPSSTSSTIQSTFYGLTVIILLDSSWLIYQIRPRF